MNYLDFPKSGKLHKMNCEGLPKSGKLYKISLMCFPHLGKLYLKNGRALASFLRCLIMKQSPSLYLSNA